MTTRSTIVTLLLAATAAAVVALLVTSPTRDSDGGDAVRLAPIDGVAASDATATLDTSGAARPVEVLEGVPDVTTEGVDADDPAVRLDEARAALASSDGVPLHVTGQVVDIDGHPVGDLLVRLLPDTDTARAAGLPVPELVTMTPSGERWIFPELPFEAYPSMRTDADGRFALDVALVDHGEVPSYRMPRQTLLVMGEGRANLVHGFEAAGGEHAVDRLVVQDEVLVRGRLVDDEGRPLAGVRVAREDVQDHPSGAPYDFAEVRFADFEPLTDADGRFLVRGAGPGLLRLSVRLPGRVGWSARLELVAGARIELGDVLVTHGRALAGSVVDDASGAPLADARVLVTSSPPSGVLGGCIFRSFPEDGDVLLTELDQVGSHPFYDESSTDVDGRFRIAGLDQASMSLYAVRDGFEPVRLDELRPGLDEPVVRLTREARLVLDVVDAEGRPLDGSALRAVRRSTGALPDDPVARTRAIANGTFDHELPVLEGEQARSRDADFEP
ncbi:MAG: carboxypeptidase regulatory-like domain-containing protein, partial [Planctomycetes bacterium]|nr:carboxypeptidase regulatory-like domain-containing protein [Planctomycetota bacterium]